MNRHETPFATPDQRPSHLIPLLEEDGLTILELLPPAATNGELHRAVPGDWDGYTKVPTAVLEMRGDGIICD